MTALPIMYYAAFDFEHMRDKEKDGKQREEDHKNKTPLQ